MSKWNPYSSVYPSWFKHAVTIVAALFMSGVIWSNLNHTVGDNQKRSKENTEIIKIIGNEITKLKIRQEVIVNQLSNIDENASRERAENIRRHEEILDRLGK